MSTNHVHGTHTHTPLTCTPGATLSMARTKTRCPRTRTWPLTNTQTGPHIQVAAAWLPHRHVVSSPSVSSGEEKRTGSVHPDLWSHHTPHSHQRVSGERDGPQCAHTLSARAQPCTLRESDLIPCHVQTRDLGFEAYERMPRIRFQFMEQTASDAQPSCPLALTPQPKDRSETCYGDRSLDEELYFPHHF